jgi:hypothetical protein
LGLGTCAILTSEGCKGHDGIGQCNKKGRHELLQLTSVNYYVHVSQSSIAQFCTMSNSTEDYFQANRPLDAQPDPAPLKSRYNLNLLANFNDHIFPLRPHLIVQQKLEHQFAFGLLRRPNPGRSINAA